MRASRAGQRAAIVAGLGVATALACGPVPGRPPPVAPVNACPPNACSSYASGDAVITCVDGVCQSPIQLDYVLTVAMPETGGIRASAGYTLVVKSSDLFVRATATCGKPSCIVMPDLAPLRGVYIVPPASAQAVGLKLSATNESVSLPVRSQLRPFFRPTGNASAPSFDAVLYGLPVFPLVGTVTPRRAGDPFLGPYDTVGLDFRVGVQSGPYQVIAAPAPPFDTVFPPFTTNVEVNAEQLLTITSVFDLFRFPVSRVGGSLEGFRARLVDEDTGATQSSVAVLGKGSTDFTLATYRYPPSAATPKLDLLLEPPADVAPLEPTLVYKFVASTTPPITYPALVAPVAVTGIVEGEGEDGGIGRVPSTLVWDSANVTTGAAVPGLTLRYRKRIDTDESGRYTLAVPPGSYRVAIIPHDRPSGEGNGRFAKVVRAIDVPAGTGLEVPVTMPTAARVRGRVVLADGKPLPNATVAAEPSTTLPATTADPAAFFDGLPRPSEVLTGPDGSFEITLDPGTFDLSVRPWPESRWPWVVLPARTFGAADGDLGTLTVPVPIVQTFDLRDPLENAVRGAVVQAYALPPGGTSLVRIGLSQSDQTGRFVMDLAGLPTLASP